MRHCFRLWALASLLSSLILLSAQTTEATLSGVVVDTAGRAIVGAEIAILNESTGTQFHGTTNRAGIYMISILPPGQYRVEVSKNGFKTLIKPGIVLNVQSAIALNFTLPVGATSETVTVEAGTSSINTADGTVSTVIDRQFVANMPLNGRSFQDLLSLAPGVTQVAASAGYGYGVGFSGDIVVNGQRAESNYFTVDGVSANVGAISGGSQGAGVSGSLPAFTALGTTQGLASIDDLEEFRSNTSTYSAEYGRSPGGQFAFSTRSGTEALHGSLYEFLRNDALDANNWFNDFYGEPKGKERQNDFGGTLSGPLVVPHVYDGRKKTFYFVSYEGLRLTSPQAATEVEVPEESLRQQAPAALAPLLNAFPVANGASDGRDDGFAYYIETVSYPSTLTNISLRLDHTVSDRLRLFGRYADTPTETSSYSGAVRQFTQNRTQSVTLGTTWTVSAQQSNEFRLNFTRSGGRQAAEGTALGGATPFDLGSLPGPGGASFPGEDSDLYIVFNFANYANLSLSNLPQTQDQWNFIDNHSWGRGRHSFKAGIDWRQLRTKLNTISPTEEMAFGTESQVLSNAPDFGYVTTSGRADDNQPVYRYFSAYGEDEWRPAPRLSVSAGVRWDLSPAPTNANGPVPYTVTEITDLATTELAPLGTALWSTDWKGIAPRLGAAFELRPGSNWNTVVRAGFGVFYDPGNLQGSAGYTGIGFASAAVIPDASFPMTSAQLSLPAPSTAPPYGGYLFGFDPKLRLPYSFQYNLAVEQALGSRDSLTLGYVGSGARRLLTTFETDPADLGNTNFSPDAVLNVTAGRASSSYNSFQAKYRRDLHQGLQALVSYTYAHSIDDASSNFGIYYLLRASSDFDIRQDLEAAITYQTPRRASSTALSVLIGDWGLDLRVQAHTAAPVDVIGSMALSPGTGTYLQYQANRVPGESAYVYGPAYPGGRALNYAAFSIAPSGVEGDLPRNYGRGFSLVQFNPALRRDFPIHDRLHLEARAEAFNVFNHPMFGPIYNYLSYGPALFGMAFNTANSIGNLNSLYQAGGPRSLQVSLKVLF